MKQVYSLIIVFCILISCTENQPELQSSEHVKADTVIMETDTVQTTSETEIIEIEKPSYKDSLNYTDENGLKQGTWEEYDKEINEDVSCYYVDGLREGQWYTLTGMRQEGTYKNGLREGYSRWYYGETNKHKVMVLSYFEKGEYIWSAHPAADHGQLTPIKGINVTGDSVYVKIPYKNGNLWYEGTLSEVESQRENYIGIHKVYYPNGVLHGLINYDDGWYKEYDTAGNLLVDNTLWGRRLYTTI